MTSITVPAPPEVVWSLFMDPRVLVRWLPPGGMTGVIHRFNGKVGGGYEMSLTYPPGDNRGKTAANEDRVRVAFTKLDEPNRIVEAVTFVSDDPAFAGVMTIEITLEHVRDGTKITMRSRDLPPGIRPEDNDEGTRQSLDNLAAWFR